MKKKTKIPIGTTVKIGEPIPDSLPSSFKGDDGVVIHHHANSATGHTKARPLHEVKFKNQKTECFWVEELLEVN